MKVKRFVVPSMQVGLKQVADTLGPGAVILSNKKLAQGLEIVAGVDETDLADHEARQGARPDPDAIIKANRDDRPEHPKLDQQSMQEMLQALAPKSRAAFGDVERESAAANSAPPAQPQPARVSAPKPEKSAPAPREGVDHSAQRELMSVMREEIDSLRQMLREQTEFLREPPLPAASPRLERLEARLQSLGLSASVQRSLLRHYDSEITLDTNWRRLMGRLAAGLSVPVFDPLAQGGRIALCGPTGAGKTTTLAKMAARYVKAQGNQGVAIVSTDCYQLGAQDTLASVARILEVEFVGLNENDDLGQVLAGLDHHLVLIDTSGSREALRQWRRQVIESGLEQDLQTVMVVPATTHSDSLTRFMQAFPARRIAGAIVTKLDEAPCFGSIFDCILRHRWPLWYSTDGQNIPRDLAPCEPAALVKRLAQGLNTRQGRLAEAS